MAMKLLSRVNLEIEIKFCSRKTEKEIFKADGWYGLGKPNTYY